MTDGSCTVVAFCDWNAAACAHRKPSWSPATGPGEALLVVHAKLSATTDQGVMATTQLSRQLRALPWNTSSTVEVSSGFHRGCAIRTGGSLWCWGSKYEGALEIGPLGHDAAFPVRVQPHQWGSQWTQLQVVSVGCGNAHTCAALSDGAVLALERREAAWAGDSTSRNSPALETAPGPINMTLAKQVSTGAKFTCAVTLQPSVWCWGTNGKGQLGVSNKLNRTRPEAVNLTAAGFELSIATVSADVAHILALTANGSVWSWGGGEYGRLGTGATADALYPAHVQPTDWGSAGLGVQHMPVIQVSAGAAHSCAILVDGSLWCWGWDVHGQLGLGQTGDEKQLEPQRVQSVAWGSDNSSQLAVVPVSAGLRHTCAVLVDGSVWCGKEEVL